MNETKRPTSNQLDMFIPPPDAWTARLWRKAPAAVRREIVGVLAELLCSDLAGIRRERADGGSNER